MKKKKKKLKIIYLFYLNKKKEINYQLNNLNILRKNMEMLVEVN